MSRQRHLEWICRGRVLKTADRPLVMGILNVTPDSFSDGGCFLDPSAAVEQGLRLLAEGADILDVGGESTRPGAAAIPEEAELERVVPVIRELARQAPQAVLSVDTMKSAVARAALEVGAHIINDVSAMTCDPAMPAVAAGTGAGVVLMHMQGTPRTMQAEPAYGNVVEEVAVCLEQRVAALAAAGVPVAAMAVDPGIGFGKTLEHNLALMANLGRLGRGGRPVVVGLSRKSFLGRLTGADVGDRLASSLAGLVFCILNGAHVMRVHDVKASRQAIDVAVALQRTQEAA